MSELGAPWDAVHTAASDQNTAQMADLGRAWAAMYHGLCAGGVPPRMAGRMVERQQATHCRLMLLGAQLAGRQGVG